MKNSLLFFTFCLVFLVMSCGPASEDRETMHKRAKVFQDSIASVIRASMDQAAMPGPAPAPVAVDTARKMNAAGTATKK